MSPRSPPRRPSVDRSGVAAPSNDQWVARPHAARSVRRCLFGGRAFPKAGGLRAADLRPPAIHSPIGLCSRLAVAGSPSSPPPFGGGTVGRAAAFGGGFFASCRAGLPLFRFPPHHYSLSCPACQVPLGAHARRLPPQPTSTPLRAMRPGCFVPFFGFLFPLAPPAVGGGRGAQVGSPQPARFRKSPPAEQTATDGTDSVRAGNPTVVGWCCDHAVVYRRSWRWRTGGHPPVVPPCSCRRGFANSGLPKNVR